MKRIYLLLFWLVAFAATAQDYKPVKVNLSLGIAKSATPGISLGLVLAAEPRYGLSDHVDLGLRLEWALIARGVVNNGATVTGNVGTFGSYLATGTYLFGTSGVRPFVGIGAGAYTITSTGTLVVLDGQSPRDVTVLGETRFGGLIRAGIKAGHFVASIDYNAVPATTNMLPNNSSIDTKNAYFGFKLGVDIGGGKQ